jgi:hypothetical protein
MRRLVLLLGVVAVTLMLFAPAVAAAQPGDLPHSGRVLVSVQGDVTLPAGEQADVVVVVQGNATVGGTVNMLVVVEGNATLNGATVENMVIVSGHAALGPGTTVLGDVRTLNATVDQQAGAVVQGSIHGVERGLAQFGWWLGPALLLFFLGFVLATIVAGLALVAVGTRQVRMAAELVRTQPAATVLWGLGAIFIPPILAVLLFITVIGVPLGLGILLFAWPLLAYIGYLFAGVMLGDWLVTRMRAPAPPVGRPYVGAVIGLLLVQILGIFPPIAFIVSFVGVGAVLQLAWRTMRGAPRPSEAVPTSWGTGTQAAS